MSGTHGNPFRGFVDMMSELDRMRRLGKYGHEPAAEDPGHHSAAGTYAAVRVPAADIYALGADLVIRVELPGVRAEDVDVSLVRGSLTITGHAGPGAPDGVEYYTRELHHGDLRRSMILPDQVTEDDVSARLANGVAEIVVRGACSPSEPQPGRIPITDTSDDVALGHRTEQA